MGTNSAGGSCTEETTVSSVTTAPPETTIPQITTAPPVTTTAPVTTECSTHNSIFHYNGEWYEYDYDINDYVAATPFRCDDGKCIPSHWNCDGRDDCVGREDEIR